MGTTLHSSGTGPGSWIQILIGAGFVLLAGCCTQRTPFTIPQTVPVTPQYPLKVCLPGLWNFGVVSKDVLRGATPTSEGFKTLASLGVKTVIHVGEHDESKQIPPGIKYVRIPISAWRSPDVDVYAVLAAIRDSPKPVFIHCYTGADRTGISVGAFRLTQGMSAADVCKELRNFHVKIWFYLQMKKRLYDLQRQGLSPRWWGDQKENVPATSNSR